MLSFKENIEITKRNKDKKTQIQIAGCPIINHRYVFKSIKLQMSS